MPVTLNANSSTGFIATSDTSGVLQLQTGGTTAVTVDASQRVGIGTDTPISTTLQTLQVQSGGSIVTALSGVGYGISPSISLRNAGGTSASPTASTLSPMNVVGSTTSDGTNFFNTVGFVGGIESTPTAGSHPTFFAVSTTASGSTSRTERFRVNSTGTITLQGGSTSSNGIGITFPATQSASSDANTLDDYEEGSWSPSYTNLGTVTTLFAKYTKIGNTCTIWIAFTCTSTPTANSSFFSLPFTSISLTAGSWTRSTSEGGQIEPQSGNTNCYFAKTASTSTGGFYCCATYQVS